MIRLWLLRHGDAEDPRPGGDDFGRSLTEAGESEAVAAGRALRGLGAVPDLALSSPRTRALQTAELATREIGCDFNVHEALGGGFAATDALDAVAGREGQTVLLVGHMPDLALLVRDLAHASVSLRTGGLAHLRGSGASWELLALLRPRETRGLAG